MSFKVEGHIIDQIPVGQDFCFETVQSPSGTQLLDFVKLRRRKYTEEALPVLVFSVLRIIHSRHLLLSGILFAFHSIEAKAPVC